MICIICGQDKEPSAFSKRGRGDQLRTECKKCFYQKYQKPWDQRHPGKVRDHRERKSKRYREELEKGERAIPDKKKCPKCGKVKPSDAFYTNATAHDGLQGYCIHCMQGYLRDYSS